MLVTNFPFGFANQHREFFDDGCIEFVGRGDGWWYYKFVTGKTFDFDSESIGPGQQLWWRAIGSGELSIYGEGGKRLVTVFATGDFLVGESGEFDRFDLWDELGELGQVWMSLR